MVAGLNDVRFVLNPIQLARAFRSPAGPLVKELMKIALDIEGRAKQYCPVDTGRLRASIANEVTSEGDTFAAYVGTNVEYAPHIEFGTYRMQAQSFLRRAADDVARGM